MKSKYLIPAVLIFLFACTVLKPLTQPKQGLSGYIYILKGNQMPSPGKALNKGRGVTRDILIYQPTTISQTTGSSPAFISIKTKLVATTKSDSTGHYSIALPAGSYSVFVKEGGYFFAAESDGNGVLNPVSINTNTITQKSLTITLNTAF